ncbi:adenosylcobinamide-GDP ribazoletransferase [Haloplanus pelagicus]|uniref:adenosylcobinamide-GDP ribazoletransferase n=1 Tax=Haloplanus pelagicus TaxID=2949995 RepID=UPI0020421B64|nr:adenosylcobinamide-GDP ribazoletransferase [Haloplanus sp. HW8-1]
MLTAVRGALAFLTRLPVGSDGAAWDAFRATPAAFVVAGYVVGGLAALPLLAPVPVSTAVAGYLVALYLVTGVTHADGLADCGDAAAAHGAAADRREILRDSRTGVGGALALGVALVALALGGLGAAGAGPRVSVRLVLAAEVSAKAGMAALAALGDPGHEGLGSAVVGEASGAALLPAVAVAVPAALAAPSGSGPALLAALLAGPAVALLVGRWATARLGGVTGDAFGAANELGRIAALHAGVIAWTLW